MTPENPQKPPEHQPGKRRRIYFRPGQVLLLVEHAFNPQLTQEGIAAGVFTIPEIKADKRMADAKIESRRIVTFPQGTNAFELRPSLRARQGAFSIVPLDVSGAVKSSKELIQMVEDLNGAFLQIVRPRLDMLLTPRAATPNWLTVPTPNGDPANGGGPGARPRRYEGPLKNIPYKFTVSGLAGTLEFGMPQAVDVAILDTAPSRAAIEDAFQQYPNHDLLKLLLDADGKLGPNAPLQISYAADLGIVLPHPDELSVKDHDYCMEDHGLFIAGIIRSIAPDAKLHLYQVLNDVGVGATSDIAEGFLALSRQRTAASRPLVVNCSLMIVEPRPTQHKLKDDKDPEEDELDDWERFKKRAPEQLSPAELDMLRLLSLTIQWICLSVFDQNIVVVAAAGNDAINGHSANRPERPEARFPAAFDKVLGVGALDKDGGQASYSNRADEPEVTGLTTFGGTAEMVEIEPGKEVAYAVPDKAVLGVYIGEFPDLAPGETIENSNGWGWWAGTSFSAPVISGILAALIGRGAMPLQAVATLRGAPDGSTPDGEEILRVIQG